MISFKIKTEVKIILPIYTHTVTPTSRRVYTGSLFNTQAPRHLYPGGLFSTLCDDMGKRMPTAEPSLHPLGSLWVGRHLLL